MLKFLKDTIKHLRDIFIQKKIRNDIDLNEMIDDEDENQHFNNFFL